MELQFLKKRMLVVASPLIIDILKKNILEQLLPLSKRKMLRQNGTVHQR